MIKVDISDDYDMMSRKAAELIIRIVNIKPDSLLCFPAGNTPAGIFKYLTGFSSTGRVDFSQSIFVGLDEFVGLTKEDIGSCKHFMYTNLFKPLNIKEEHICFFDACSEDLAAECQRIDSFIFKNGPIDLVMLGIGINGHVGFNEPGDNMNLYSHVVKLQDTTKLTGQKYFKTEVSLDRGITLGMKHLTEAREIILIASGATKADIVRKVVEEQPAERVPAGMLQSHENCMLLLDKDAASYLKVSEAAEQQE